MRSPVRGEERPKEMNNTVVFRDPLSQKKKRGERADLKGWDYVCTFGNCIVYAKGDKRRLIREDTGEIVIEYYIGIHKAEFRNGDNAGRVNERKSNVKL